MGQWKKILLEGDAAVLTTVAPKNVLKQTAAAGTATTAARWDHAHDVTLGVPIPVIGQQSAAEGTATKMPRADHVHAAYGSFSPKSHILSLHGTAIGPLWIGKQQLNQAALHRTGTAPTTPGTGQIYYNSSPGTRAPFVYTA